MRTFVDRGGTFTDLVSVGPDGRVGVRKVRSDAAVVGELARGALIFGTTVATNALLERKGVPTVLVVSEGFADLPQIGDQSRPELFDPHAAWPPPLCTAVIETGGRIDAAGREIEPLDGELALPTGPAPRSVAIVLVNSHAEPAHELGVAEAVRRRWPDVFIALGHRASPELGYLARIETTLVDAAITPLLAEAMTRDRIPPGALAMRSDGSLAPADELRAPDAVLSGPAGGVLAVEAICRQAGFEHAVGLDMGGTSTDVCRVDAGELPHRRGDVRVAGIRLRRPMLEVETIAAGGGSIVSSDGLRLTVGPESAGADPGPASYGRGGPATLTDAALLAGLLDPEAFDPPLDPGRVSLPAPPEQILDIAREAMAQAVRRLATARGVDLADHALVAYGGAAGQHAAPVADRLGIRTVLIHPCASVLSAWGQALARREEVAVRPVWRPLAEAISRLPAMVAELAATLADLGELEAALELRHAGTDHAFAVPLPDPHVGLAALERAFVAEHRRRFGFDRRESAVELVNVRVRTREPRPPLPKVDDDPWGVGASDDAVAGPVLLTSPTTSVLVPEGWSARLDGGLLRLERLRAAAPPAPRRRTPYAVELWQSRFAAVAEEAGTVLRRLARSVNIRERLDFSCAIFDESGALVANAPHIPVHLGAMGETVRDLLAREPDAAPGQSWLSNAPDAGGSHLPDLTVVTAVGLGARRFFVASRAHHVDVGGITPGSMPPRSASLAEEGFVLRRLPLTEGGALRDIADRLVGCREPATVLADLEAQVAANAHAARLLRELGPAPLLATWMAHLADVAAESVSRLLPALELGTARDRIAGIPLQMALSLEDGRLVVDLEGTGGPHAGNLNAPSAVVSAAVLYGLRLLVARPIPLNEGALRSVTLRRPEPSLVAPPPDAAVAGGNVETSQRLVDLFLRAAGAMASSQGTMNNLTIGGGAGEGSAWSVYETMGGGAGASKRGPGASAHQVHMTNTRATDVEVAEARLPLRIRRFAVRRGSGGAGLHRGGDGLIREIELLAPATASLLATRRESGAPGLGGGLDGAPGRDEIRRKGRWEPWDGRPVALRAGDRVRVATPGGGGWGAPDAAKGGET